MTNMARYIRWFDELSIYDVSIVGGENASQRRGVLVRDADDCMDAVVPYRGGATRRV
jgi:hypothetical protein